MAEQLSARDFLRKRWVEHLAKLGDAATPCELCAAVRADLMNDFIISTMEAFAAKLWIPISKQPDVGQWVHVIINGIVQKMPCALDLHGWGGEAGKTWRWLDETADHAPFEAVSHWQALPEAP